MSPSRSRFPFYFHFHLTNYWSCPVEMNRKLISCVWNFWCWNSCVSSFFKIHDLWPYTSSHFLCFSQDKRLHIYVESSDFFFILYLAWIEILLKPSAVTFKTKEEFPQQLLYYSWLDQILKCKFEVKVRSWNQICCLSPNFIIFIDFCFDIRW